MLTCAELSDNKWAELVGGKDSHEPSERAEGRGLTKLESDAELAKLATSRHELCRRVVAQGRAALEAQQICRRMRELLRARLQQLVAERRGECGVARAKRKALLDPRYLDYVEQVIDVCSKAQVARIRHATYLMYYEVM